MRDVMERESDSGRVDVIERGLELCRVCVME